MGFCDDIKVLDAILNKKTGVHEVKKITYPCFMKAKILTAHIRRTFLPRQINSSSQKEIKVKLMAEGVFTQGFLKRMLKEITKDSMICPHCIIGAWLYLRVGTKTYTLILKGDKKELPYVKIPNELEWK